MKKLLFSLLITFVAFSFNSCSSDDTDNTETPTEGKIKLTITIMEESEVSLDGLLYLFEIPAIYNNFVRYDEITHTYTNFDGTMYKATQVLTVKLGKTETYIKSNSNYIYAYEPKDNPSGYKVGNFESFDKDKAFYIR